jgi:hypothetical protein
MTLPRSLPEVLDDHVLFELECIDRLYLNLYQPKFMWPGGVVGFFKGHRGMPFASGALMDPISKSFVASIHRYVADHGLDLVAFEKGQRKDDVAHDYLARHDGSEGVLFVGRAQEKARVYRTQKRVNPDTGRAYPWLAASTAMVNHFYFYAVDDDFGPFFIKFGDLLPLHRQGVFETAITGPSARATKAGIGHVGLDNAFASCEDPAALQRICERLSPSKIDRFCRKWLARLPHPFTAADRRAGHRYDISVLQAEFSLTQVLDRPLAGRVFFEEAIRNNLDAGRPDQVSLTFARRVTRRTPGRFRTRVSPTGSFPPSTLTTSDQGSSSTSSKESPFAPRPPSTTPVTSPSAAGCTTCPHCGRSVLADTLDEHDDDRLDEHDIGHRGSSEMTASNGATLNLRVERCSTGGEEAGGRA